MNVLFLILPVVITIVFIIWLFASGNESGKAVKISLSLVIMLLMIASMVCVGIERKKSIERWSLSDNQAVSDDSAYIDALYDETDSEDTEVTPLDGEGQTEEGLTETEQNEEGQTEEGQTETEQTEEGQDETVNSSGDFTGLH